MSFRIYYEVFSDHYLYSLYLTEQDGETLVERVTHPLRPFEHELSVIQRELCVFVTAQISFAEYLPEAQVEVIASELLSHCIESDEL